jgi:hypothetical protein
MRDPAKTFEDLVVWQKAHQYVIAVCRIRSRGRKPWAEEWARIGHGRALVRKPGRPRRRG